jgi:hypothetical protein
MYFEISLAVFAKSLPGFQRRVSIGTRSKKQPVLNSPLRASRVPGKGRVGRARILEEKIF